MFCGRRESESPTFYPKILESWGRFLASFYSGFSSVLVYTPLPVQWHVWRQACHWAFLDFAGEGWGRSSIQLLYNTVLSPCKKVSPPLWLPLLFHRETHWGRSEPHGCRQLSSRHTEEKVHWQVRRHLDIAILSASTFFTKHGYPDVQESYYPFFLYCYWL